MSVSLSRRAATAGALAACAVVGVPAAASAASPADLGPVVTANQYFTGVVTGVPSTGPATLPAIGVACAGPATTGTPLPGQTVEVKLVIPPTSVNVGFTGSAADSIQADLIWSQGVVVVVSPIATFHEYSVALPIPTDIKVPCSGRGEVSFMPEPTSKTAVSSVVQVEFLSTGV